MGGVRIQFGRGGVGKAKHVAGELYHAHLHSKAYPQEGDAVLTRILDGVNLPFKASLSEARCHQDSIHTLEIIGCVAVGNVFAQYGVNVYLAVVCCSCVDKGLLDGFIGILQ